MTMAEVTGAMGEALAALRRRAISADADREVLVYIDMVVDRLKATESEPLPLAVVDVDVA